MKIKDTLERYSRELLLIVLIILVSGVSFGIGRLSVRESMSNPIQFGTVNFDSMEKEAAADSINEEHNIAADIAGNKDFAGEESVRVVVSKNGTKYHYEWCPGAGQMNEENKIYFDTIAEAREAGYEPAANCKGLK